MKQAEQARLFLAKAAEDESLLDAVLPLPGVSDAIFGFHCQQAAEKLLKGLLSHHGVAFSRTHDLNELSMLDANPARLHFFFALAGLYSGQDHSSEQETQSVPRTSIRNTRAPRPAVQEGALLIVLRHCIAARD